MLGPLGTALTAVAAFLLGAGLLVPAAAATTEEPDTTPPRVRLDPCPEVPLGEACSRRDAVWVAESRVDPAEGLAVAGVRSGDVVLGERVYDDGAGFVPYGLWVMPYSDVGSDYDYVTETWLDGPGPHELTFYARDLAGNEASVTRTVIGPEVPRRPWRFSVEHRRGATAIGWYAHGRGSGITDFVLRFKGEKPFRLDGGGIVANPGLGYRGVTLPLAPGRHVLRVHAVNLVGEGAPGRFVFRVPRR